MGGVAAVEPATDADVEAIAELVNFYARAGLLLPRSPAMIRSALRRFLVARQDGRVVGCVALEPMGPGLAEIRSLAVHPDAHGQGIGRSLVEACLEQAAREGIPRVFALTYEVGFFRHLGFEEVPKERFPEKVWRDCRLCPRRHACDEVAVLKRVAVAPAVEEWVAPGGRIHGEVVKG